MGSRFLCGGRSAFRLTVLALLLGLASCGSDEPDGAAPEVNLEPVAQFFGGFGAVAGRELSFDASASSDRDGRIVAYHWLFGDGHSANGARVRHTYDRPGRYQITLTVLDNDGARARTDRSIVVADPATGQGDVANGEKMFDLHCDGCHVVGDPFDTSDLARLTEVIEATMPPGNAVACDAECSADIAAFIATWY